jgi:hypothetical protein
MKRGRFIVGVAVALAPALALPVGAGAATFWPNLNTAIANRITLKR